MIDSMPFHAKSWSEFTRRHEVAMDIDEVMRRTTGRNGVECMRELFGPQLAEDRALALVAEKEGIYRELFAPVFAEVRGFRRFAGQARERGLKLAVGTAGDRHNIEFALARLQLEPPPHAVVGGDEGQRGKPDPAIFLEAARRAGMRAVAVFTTHSPADLAGSHVVAQVRDYEELMKTKFLESLDA